MTRLLIECTYVFEHPETNSGIQRVVRNVIRELPAADASVECIPVVMLKGQLLRVLSLKPLKPERWNLMGLRVRLEQMANVFWLRHRTLERRKPFDSYLARRLLYVACRLTALVCFSIPLRLCNRFLNTREIPSAAYRCNINRAINWCCWTHPGMPTSFPWPNNSSAMAWVSSR